MEIHCRWSDIRRKLIAKRLLMEQDTAKKDLYQSTGNGQISWMVGSVV
jgi:hypothetical protein